MKGREGDGEKWKRGIIKIGSDGWKGDEEKKGEKMGDERRRENKSKDRRVRKANR